MAPRTSGAPPIVRLSMIPKTGLPNLGNLLTLAQGTPVGEKKGPKEKRKTNGPGPTIYGGPALTGLASDSRKIRELPQVGLEPTIRA